MSTETERTDTETVVILRCACGGEWDGQDGETSADVREHAREWGWFFTDTGRDVCPDCNPRDVR